MGGKPSFEPHQRTGIPSFDLHQVGGRVDYGNPADMKRQRDAADHKTYFVCKGFGKSDGERMWTCPDKQFSLAEAQDWIKRQVAEEADFPRRTWEAPYVYMIIQTGDKKQVAHVLGTEPLWVAGKEPLVVSTEP